MLTLEVILNQVRTGVRSPLNAPHQPNLVAATPQQRWCLQLPPDLLLAMQKGMGCKKAYTEFKPSDGL